jgi:hypothetical protein
MFRVIMETKKVGGDLEAQKQNVAPSEPRVDESNNPCSLELAMVVVCNSNDEISHNTNWEF